MVRQVPRVLHWMQGQVFLPDFFGRRSRSRTLSLPDRGDLEALTRRGQDQMQDYQFDGGGKLRASKEKCGNRCHVARLGSAGSSCDEVTTTVSPT